jgi:hypothetical protein
MICMSDDVLARIVVSYCSLKDRVHLIRSCKQIRRTILSRRIPFGVNEQIEIHHYDMLENITGWIQKSIVRSLNQWTIINTDEKQMRSIRKMTMTYDVVNQYTKLNRNVVESDVCEIVLPNSIESLRLLWIHNKPEMERSVIGWNLPANLTSLRLGEGFNQKVEGWVLPASLLSIDMECSFNQTITEWCLPANLLSINMEVEFDQPVIGWVLPNSMTSITLAYYFKQPVIGWILPNNLQILNMGCDFNQPVEGWILPHSLTTIEMGSYFNQPVCDWILPNSLTSLKLGDAFNQPIDGWILPNNMNRLDVGLSFDQCVKRLKLPFSLRSIRRMHPGSLMMAEWRNRNDVAMTCDDIEYESYFDFGLYFDIPHRVYLATYKGQFYVTTDPDRYWLLQMLYKRYGMNELSDAMKRAYELMKEKNIDIEEIVKCDIIESNVQRYIRSCIEFEQARELRNEIDPYSRRMLAGLLQFERDSN